jgi:hypothetical protein
VTLRKGDSDGERDEGAMLYKATKLWREDKAKVLREIYTYPWGMLGSLQVK